VKDYVFEHANIIANEAVVGAGIYLDLLRDDTPKFGPESSIQENVASQYGGGIYIAIASASPPSLLSNANFTLK
jgi:hypothetical protein